MISNTMLTTHLIAIYRDNTSTIGDLIMVLGDNRIDGLPTSTEQQVYDYSLKAIALLAKRPLPTSTSIKSLILDDDGFIEADTHDRKLHNALNFATMYANAV
ncbi:TPA: hypothetical protein ACPVYZ_004310 [Vibrio parahaemolyticus]|nr:hypothetical protein [Vibrio parahaemolyticus]